MALDLNFGRVGTVISVVVGAVLVLTVLGALTDTFFNAVEDINDNVTANDTSTGNDEADDLLDAFPPIIGIIGVIGFVGLVFAAFSSVNKRGGNGGL